MNLNWGPHTFMVNNPEVVYLRLGLHSEPTQITVPSPNNSMHFLLDDVHHNKRCKLTQSVTMSCTTAGYIQYVME